MKQHSAPRIDVRDLTVSFEADHEQYLALDRANIMIQPGSFVSLVGPTGCGKTTLLNVIAGLLPPSDGEVRLHEAPLHGLNRNAGYMFQQDTLLPWRTVIENVALGLRYQGISRKERRDRARTWVTRVGLDGFEDAYPYQLSGGMRKRASMAQVLIIEPTILLMDEPFGALDAQTRQLMESELLDLWADSGTTVVFVTHDLDEAVALSDEVALLSVGPGSRIISTYDVGLSRPRDLLEVRSSGDFVAVREKIWQDLREQVRLTYERKDHL